MSQNGNMKRNLQRVSKLIQSTLLFWEEDHDQESSIRMFNVNLKKKEMVDTLNDLFYTSIYIQEQRKHLDNSNKLILNLEQRTIKINLMKQMVMEKVKAPKDGKSSKPDGFHPGILKIFFCTYRYSTIIF